jgi:hypothetical protein
MTTNRIYLTAAQSKAVAAVTEEGRGVMIGQEDLMTGRIEYQGWIEVEVDGTRTVIDRAGVVQKVIGGEAS